MLEIEVKRRQLLVSIYNTGSKYFGKLSDPNESIIDCLNGSITWFNHLPRKELLEFLSRKIPKMKREQGREKARKALCDYFTERGEWAALEPLSTYCLAKLGEEAKGYNRRSRKRRELEETASQLAEVKAEWRTSIISFYEANLRLVVSFVRRFPKGKGLDFEDLLQEGYLGLLKAVHKFDLRKDCRFSTYASWWIRQSCNRAIYDTGRDLRIPTHAYERIRKIKRTEAELSDKCCTLYISDADIAESTGYPLKTVSSLRHADKTPLSLDNPLGDNEDSSTFLDRLVDENTLRPDESLDSRKLTERFSELLSRLPERESEVIRRRVYAGQTLREIGNRLDVSRERIRQIENLAVGKLRHPAKSSRLRGFL